MMVGMNVALGEAIVVANTSAGGTVEGYFRGPAIALDGANDVLYVTYDPTSPDFSGSGPILKLPNASTRSTGTTGGEQLFNNLGYFPSRLLVQGGKLFALGYNNIFSTTCPLTNATEPA